MYHLSNFCRICIKSDSKLYDVNSKDFDLVKLSEKLQSCTKMVISDEDLSKCICIECIKKLRITYLFQSMCKKSNEILNEYVTELQRATNDPPEKFINSELKVTLTPINLEDESVHYIKKQPSFRPKFHEIKLKRKRVSKGQRCSLLKKLLTTVNSNSFEPKTEVTTKRKNGGLKNLLGFIKGYNFGFTTESIQESTPLDRLENFSRTFFYTDFSEYQETILSVINESRNDDEIEEMFHPFDEEEDRMLWETDKFEEVFIEPDIKIKSELINEGDYDAILPSDCVQACYEPEGDSKEFVDFEAYLHKKNKPHKNYAMNNNNIPTSLDLLQALANSTRVTKRTISPNSLKCRTRGHPFINPQLMEQFQKQSFKCDTCNRCFKSPGYLHSHCTKMGH